RPHRIQRGRNGRGADDCTAATLVPIAPTDAVRPHRSTWHLHGPGGARPWVADGTSPGRTNDADHGDADGRRGRTGRVNDALATDRRQSGFRRAPKAFSGF